MEEPIETIDPALSEELLQFFKALSDANRLKIVGLLAQRPHSVEELAGLLSLSVSTTSHHLGRLSKAGLVTARSEGHYYFYSLQTEVLREMSQRLLHTENLPMPKAEEERPDFDRKVIASFVDEAGRIKAFPSQEKKLQVLLRYVLRAFEPGTRYTEKQVNAILGGFNEDTAYLRRSLVEYHYMERQGGGGEYWLPE